MVKIGDKNVRSIRIQFYDKSSKKSKSITVYNKSMEDLFYNVVFFIDQINNYDDVKLLCYRRKVNGNEKIN